MTEMMKRIALASRPAGEPTAENFRLEESALPQPGPGEVLVRCHYMSLDPYMRGRMSDAESYAEPVAIGETMTAGAVGEVIASNHPRFAPGDFAFGMFGWASHGVQPGDQLRKVDPQAVPISTALGVLGMPGLTGWSGLRAYGKPQAGETLVVAAATGPVGSMVGQIAKRAGCRVIGVAGGVEKCRIATETFGFDACIDHRGKNAAAMREALAEACPDGIDIYFENVGGAVLGGVLPLMNLHGRIVVCGMIAWYNGVEDDPTAQMPLAALWRRTLVKRLQINGLLVGDHFHLFPDFAKEVAPLVASGEIAYLEDVAEGLENAPATFIKLLKGGNTGKQVVKLI